MADEIDKQIAVIDGDMTAEEAAQPEYQPQYQVFAQSRIPVSKVMGTFWKQRNSEAKKVYENKGYIDRWDEVIRYYQNDQGGRGKKRSKMGEVATSGQDEQMYGTENIVFANSSALLPSIYAKNPDIEITAIDKTQENQAKLFEELLDTLFNRKNNPGLNIKPKIRRAALMCILTNISYLDLSYIKKDDSSEQTLQEIEELGTKLAEAKNITEIAEIEGKLQALESKVNFLSPSGPMVATREPKYILADPDGENADLSDSAYIQIGVFVRTNYLRAVYGTTNPDGSWKSIFAPTHVLPASVSDIAGHDEEINNFTLLQSSDDHTKHGYNSKEEYDDNCRTLVWYVWDKTTRRVLMFNDKDWTWPIWVWDDPYNLSRFYPVFALSFYADPIERIARSEVMYYLDQQDEINMINNERARMRHWVMTKVFIDSNTIPDATKIQQFLNGKDTNKYVFGLALPEGKKISDVIGTMAAPSMQFEQLFDIKQQLEGINRLSSVTPVLQAQQYKTNTTNRAIESYESTTQTRLDEKIDAMEEVMGDIAVALLEMCVQFMDSKTVEQLLGATRVQELGGWSNMTVQQFNEKFNLQVVGGSTLKPTSKVKKELAMQLGQILGQFAAASPVVVMVMLKMMERAFGEDVVITPEEWTMVQQSIATQTQAQGQPAQGGGEGGGDPNAAINQAMETVSQLFDGMPPEMKQQTGEAIAQGIPLKQIVGALMQQAQQQQQPQQQGE